MKTFAARRLAPVLLAKVLLAIVLLAIMPVAAQAQSIGDLLPIAIPGYATAPGVTAASRLQHQAASRGIVLGDDDHGLTIDPSIGASLGFDSATGATGTASGVLRTDPAVSVTDPTLGLAGFAGAAINRYTSDPAANANDITAAIGLDLPLGSDTATFGLARVASQQTALGLSSSGSAAPFGVVLNDARIALRLPFGQFDATERFDLGEASLSQTDTLPAAFKSRTTLRASSEIAGRDDGVLRWLALIKASLARYRGAVPGAGFSNESAVSVLGGVETSPDAVLRLRLLAGGVSQHFAPGATASGSAGITPIGAIGLGWTPDGLISAELDLTREAGIETTLGTPGSAVTSADLAVAEAYTRDLTFTARLAARAGTVARRPAREIDATIGLAWHVSPDFTLAPTLSDAVRHDVPGSAAREMVAMIAVVWTP